MACTTLNAGPSGDTRTDPIRDTLFLTIGIETVPPSINILAEAENDRDVKLPSDVLSLMCEAVILLSSPWNPPTRKSIPDTISDGYMLVSPSRWLPPNI